MLTLCVTMLIEIIYKTFKAHHSTNQCKFVAQKVIQYYLNNGLEVYGCTLEMQKAFDKLDLLKFFGKLEVHQLPVHMLRLLFFYITVFCCVFTGKTLFRILRRHTKEQSRARSYPQFYSQSSLMTF